MIVMYEKYKWVWMDGSLDVRVLGGGRGESNEVRCRLQSFIIASKEIIK